PLSARHRIRDRPDLGEEGAAALADPRSLDHPCPRPQMGAEPSQGIRGSDRSDEVTSGGQLARGWFPGRNCRASGQKNPLPRRVWRPFGVIIRQPYGGIAMDKPVTPRGINHLVLNVRDLEESHRFWTEVVGFKKVGELTPTADRPNPPKMRFYSGVREDGTSHHHDIALVENRDLPAPPADWKMFGMPVAVNHIAISMPSREAWLEHLTYLQKKGVK